MTAFYFKIIFSAFIIFYLVDIILDFLNFRRLKKDNTEAYADMASSEEVLKMRSYTAEKLIFDICQKTFNSLLTAVFIFAGLINYYNSFIFSFDMNYYLNGIAYLYLIVLAASLLDIPFSLFGAFKIEKKYGFNTMTLKLWFADFFKSQVISFIIFAVIISLFFALARYCFYWWFYLWLVLLVISLFIMYISPYVIEPLFNKFYPVEDDNLVTQIRELLKKAGIKLSKVQKIDASKRTKHTNAYFSGIGRTKKIVLYDTLMEKLTQQELLSVIAHEAGHWKKRHILKKIIMMQAILLIFCNLAYQLINSDFIIRVFGIYSRGVFFSVELYLPCVIFLVYIIFALAMYPMTPIFNHISRTDEMEADFYACNMIGNTSDLSEALKKLARDNLSNLNPSRLYSLFHYSHPPLLQRLEYIKNFKKGVNPSLSIQWIFEANLERFRGLHPFSSLALLNF